MQGWAAVLPEIGAVLMRRKIGFLGANVWPFEGNNFIFVWVRL